MKQEDLIILFKRDEKKCPGCRPAKDILESLFKTVHVVNMESTAHKYYRFAKVGHLVTSVPTVRFIRGELINEVVGFPARDAKKVYLEKAIRTFGENFGGLK